MRILSVLAVIILVSFPVFGEDPEPYLKSAQMPFYPPISRTARVEGKVTIHFTVNEQGETSEIEAVTGHAMLRAAAIENVKSWEFGWPSPCACRVRREAVFVYRFSGKLEAIDRPNVIVKWFGKARVTRVEIETDLVQVQEWVLH